MLQFWVLAALLILLALLFVVEPLVRARRHRIRQEQMNVERRAQNIAIFRHRLAELDEEKAMGHLDDSQYDALKAELEATLLTDVEGEESQALQAGTTRMRWLALVLVITVPLVSLGLYFKWGAYEGVEQRLLIAQMEQAEGVPDVEELLTQLETRLHENPNNPEGWFMLARTRMSLGQYAQSAEAFLQLAKLLESEPREAAAIYGLYAQALYFASQGVFDQAVMAGIKEALDRNPDEINSIGLLGIRAFEEGNYAQAAQYWEKVLELNPDGPNSDAVRGGIERARALIAENELQAASGSLPDTDAPQLQVTVSLDPALNGQVSPTDTLFIYARELNGSPMPVAIVRKQVQDLPLTVNLDDSTAMGPMAKLSSLEQVEVVARISKQGTPTANPGDLQGVIAPVQVTPGAQSLEMVISDVIQ